MGVIRITGGAFSSRRIKVPPGTGVRPTADKVKEALFSILGSRLEDARVADLFAGSGALGLDALSRGAKSCLFVEKDPRTMAVLKANIAALELGGECRTMLTDAVIAERLLSEGPFDLVLADPPYERGLAQKTADLAGKGLLARGGALALEHSPKERPEASGGLKLFKRRKYGQTELSFFAFD